MRVCQIELLIKSKRKECPIARTIVMFKMMFFEKE
jgi:hypothetical protein